MICSFPYGDYYKFLHGKIPNSTSNSSSEDVEYQIEMLSLKFF